MRYDEYNECSGRAWVACAWVLTGLIALPAFADCTLPPAPSKIPDAATATQEEMFAAMQTLKRYNTDVTNYTKCLEFEASQNRLSRDQQTRLGDAAIDRLKALADKFNVQVRIFNKAKNGG